jgi:hypothetical protein
MFQSFFAFTHSALFPLRAPGFWRGLRGLPLGHPPFRALRLAASALAALVARPAWAAITLPMSAPQLGHFSLLMVYPESVNTYNYAQHDGYNKREKKNPVSGGTLALEDGVSRLIGAPFPLSARKPRLRGLAGAHNRRSTGDGRGAVKQGTRREWGVPTFCGVSRTRLWSPLLPLEPGQQPNPQPVPVVVAAYDEVLRGDFKTCLNEDLADVVG